MTDATITAQQNMDSSHNEHWIPDRKISMDQMRGHRFAEVALFTGTSPENAVADFYNSTGVDDPTPSRFAKLNQEDLAKAGVPQLVGIFVGAGLRFACKSRGDVVAGGQML